MSARQEKREILASLQKFLAERVFAGHDAYAEAGELQEHLRAQGLEVPLKRVHRYMSELVEEGNAERVPCSKLGEQLLWNEAGDVVDAAGAVQKTFKFLYCTRSGTGGVRGGEQLRGLGMEVSASGQVRDVLEAGCVTASQLREAQGHPQVIFRLGTSFVRLLVPGQELPVSVHVGRRGTGAPLAESGAASRECFVELRSAVLSRFREGGGGQYRVYLERGGKHVTLRQLSSTNPTYGKTLSRDEVEVFFRDLMSEELTTKVQSDDLIARKLRPGLQCLSGEAEIQLALPAYVVVNGMQAVVLQAGPQVL